MKKSRQVLRHEQLKGKQKAPLGYRILKKIIDLTQYIFKN